MKNRNNIVCDNWMTPPDFYKKLNNEFCFDFDPCPLNYNVITPENDGLLIDWGSSNFINPPYSLKLKQQFVNKALQESLKGSLNVLLLPVSTSTVLFHQTILPHKKDLRFVEKRIPFIGINSKGQKVNYHLIEETTNEKILFNGKEIPLFIQNSGQFDSMIVIF